jgi:hypothetical protein
MIRIGLVCVVIASACAEPTPGPLDETVEYWREPNGPGSYEDCLASPQSYWGCDIRIRLCDDGTMNAISGDVYWALTYTVHDAVAVGIDREGREELHFDLDALSSPELGADWMLVEGEGQLECLRW